MNFLAHLPLHHLPSARWHSSRTWHCTIEVSLGFTQNVPTGHLDLSRFPRITLYAIRQASAPSFFFAIHRTSIPGELTPRQSSLGSHGSKLDACTSHTIPRCGQRRRKWRRNTQSWRPRPASRTPSACSRTSGLGTRSPGPILMFTGL